MSGMGRASRLRHALWVGCLLVASTAQAFVPERRGPRPAAETLTAMPGAGVTKPLRVQRQLDWGKPMPPAAWSRLVMATGVSWQAGWDRATGVPSRIWGAGVAAPGANADPAVAERVARQFLADHLDLLAPGARASDFELVSNHDDGEIRSIGFVQRAAGRRVVGGQVSFRFKRDRLYVIGSEALPHVAVAVPRTRPAPAVLRDRAVASLREDLVLPNAPVSPIGDEVILPLVGDDAVLGYRLVRPLEIDGGADGRYLAYADVGTGAVVAIHQLNTYATGTVLYHGVDRHPLRGRINRPAVRAQLLVNSSPQTTSATGTITWSPDSSATVQTTVIGDLATVVNKATGNAAASAVLGIVPGGQLVWNMASDEHADAQVNAYVTTMIAKEYVRAHVDPQLRTLDDQMTVNVNIANTCNAFFDGKTINFYQATPASSTASTRCQNTALLEDVVYHEYGHRLHTASIIPGVGDFDGAMSEGASDFLAAIITEDPGMGRGFFFSDDALRHLDPDGKEWMWPADIAEIHATGKIYGGIFWDLRKALIAQLGYAQGVAVTNKLYVATMRRAINIPTSLIEALAADDDDGNLANGTPHECAIRAAFGSHGLRTASGTVVAPGTLEANALALGVIVEVTGLSERCEGDEVAKVVLDWLSPSGPPGSGSTLATPAGPDRFFAQLPIASQATTFYRARVEFEDGSVLVLADNMADRYYQIYQGRTVKLYCTDFERDPFAEGWTTGTDNNAPSPWEWGIPTSGATDPHAAFSGTHVLGQVIDGDYPARQRSFVLTPPIEVGAYSDVRVQYRRWLAVEDSHFDKAIVTANGKQAWMNYTGNTGNSSSMHHIDREWRFHDVALSSHFYGHTVRVGWEITSDEGLHLGGWSLDDVCIVANPYALCGDGVRTRTEQCDNGSANANLPDLCRTDCSLPRCGDGIVDSDEECDAGEEGAATCTPECRYVQPIEGGCCSTGGGSASGLGLGALVALLLGRRRRTATRVTA
jgi:MYXO-CTERM domain-containing protein